MNVFCRPIKHHQSPTYKTKSDLHKQALKVINSIGEFYAGAEGKAKIKLLSSIFPEMIEFDGNKCRTPKINEAVLLCLNADKGFRGNKSGKLHEKLEVSRLVEPEGEKSNFWKVISNSISGIS